MFEVAQFLSNHNQRTSAFVSFCSIQHHKMGVVCKVIGRITT